MNVPRRLVLAGSLLVVAGLPLLGQEDAAEKAPAVSKEDRFLLHLSTDRPSYRPGEEVHVSGLLLHALTNAPHAGYVAVGLEIESPRGDVVAKGHAASTAGAGMGFRWKVTDDAAGGFYTLKAKPAPGYAPAELRFEVRSYRQPRLNTDLQFVRKAYGPGDQVQATLTVTRAEGGLPAGAAATATARVDGQTIHRQTLTLDAAGKLVVSFKLPAKVETPDATLAIVIQDGGVQETAAKSIPVVLARLDVSVYPEGGDLVAGLSGRVYVEARNLSGDPADVRGRVLDSRDRVVAKFSTEHEGRGRFALTPVAGQRYRIAIDEPAGITAETQLPAVKATGLSLQTRDDRIAAGAPLIVTVAGNMQDTQKGKVTVAIRDRVIASGTVPLGSAPNPVTFHLPEWAGGVLRVTLHDAAGTPRAERLVYRAPKAGVQVKVTADPNRSTPRGKVTLAVETTQDGKPIDALIALRVVDVSTLERVDVRDRAPRLRTQVLLGSQVRELKDANVYLDDAEQGARNTDLLLGTQGWRRFAFVKLAEFERAHGDLAKRIVGQKGQPIQVVQRPRPARFGGEGRKGGAMPPAPGAAPADMPMEDGGLPDVEAPDEVAQENAPEAEPLADRKDNRQEADELAKRPMEAKREARLDEADDEMGFAEAEEEMADEPMPGRGFARRARMKKMAPQSSGPFAVVREFAFRAQAGSNVRSQFAETLYWSAGVRTGADGVHTVSFDLSDSITTFRAQADAVGVDGSLAWGETTIESRRPFYMEPKLPLEITSGDLVEVPVAIVNGTDSQSTVKMTFGAGAGLEVLDEGSIAPVTLGPDGRGRMLLRFKAKDTRGQVAVRLRGSARSGAGHHEDDVARTITIVPRGFPIEHAWGGQLSAENPIQNTIAIPQTMTPGSLVAEASVHPTPLASLAEALAALLAEPGGCFEQTSSNNYPNVMALRYMKSHEGVDPALITRASGMLDRGYERLVSFECKEKGYEWFGGDPGHEALTAYGLLEFTDMAAVMPVDDGMVQRTRRWLLSRRDGKGGFQRNSRALDSFGRAPAETTNAYITWALVEAGESEVAKETEAVLAGALASEDSYVIALAANIAQRRGDAAKARGLMKKLAKAVTKDGFVGGAVTSVTSSGGCALQVETTSLAILAWMADSDFTEPTERCMRWLLAQCQGGRFGSTQATILALRAIVTYDEARARPKADGTILIVVDGKVIDEAPFKADASGAIKLPKFADALGPGEHTVELKMVRGSLMPASLVVRYRAQTPATSPAAKVSLSTSLVDTTVTEGEATEVKVRVENTTQDGLPMTVAVIGIPGGLEVRTDRLEELKRAGTFDFVETRGRDVVIYWRDMRPREVKELTLSVVAQVPGRYTGAPSRAYLYYTDEDKVWTPGLSATIPASRTVSGR